MKRTLSLAAGLWLILGSLVQAAVLTGPITNSNNSHTYYLLAPATVGEAEAEAVTLGGHLVTINDALENAWVFGTFGLYGGVSRSLWIGLNDVAVEGQFVWMNGDPSSYRNWNPGEPNNGGGFFPYENHVVMIDPLSANAGKWNDAMDIQSHAGVVEIGAVNTNVDLLAGPITNPANGHVYYLFASSSYAVAAQLAVGLGGHLAYINDTAENNWIRDTFANFGGQPRNLWIGLNDIQQEGTYVWGNGQPAYYLNWAPGEPNDGAGTFPTEDYAMMWGGTDTPAGLWNDAGDTSVAESVVEVGEDAPPQPIAAAIRFSQVEISWNSSAQFGYQVQYSTNLASGYWFDLGGPQVGSGSTMSVLESIPVGSSGRFYRVLSSQ